MYHQGQLVSIKVQVHQNLTDDTTGIDDANGLTSTAYSYQRIRSDGGADTNIQGATGSTCTVSEHDVGKTIKVRVSFTYGDDNQESPTSEATTTVAAHPSNSATGAPTISGTAQVGETLTASTSGIEDADGLTNPTFSYQWIRNDGNADADMRDATASSYTLTSDDVGKTIKVRATFTDDDSNQESLASGATSAVAVRPPLTASFENGPASHDGSNALTFELRFSENVKLSYKALRDHGFQLTVGTVTKTRRVDKPSNVRWEIHVQPGGNGDVTILLPRTTDCDDDGAVCTEDGRMLSNRSELTVSGPGG